MTARPEPTTMRGAWPLRSRAMTDIRRPIVATSGLIRSNGSVSQAGKCSTSSPRKQRRSSASARACASVGTTTSDVDAGRVWANDASSAGRAFSGHDTPEPSGWLRPMLRPAAASTAATPASGDASLVGRRIGSDIVRSLVTLRRIRTR